MPLFENIFCAYIAHTTFSLFFFCKADGIYLSSGRLLSRTWKALYIHMYFSPIKFWDRGGVPDRKDAFHVLQNSSTWDRNYIIRPLAHSFDGGPLPPSVYLGKHWCISRDKISQAFLLHLCILQAIKNLTVGRPGNEANNFTHSFDSADNMAVPLSLPSINTAARQSPSLIYTYLAWVRD